MPQQERQIMFRAKRTPDVACRISGDDGKKTVKNLSPTNKVLTKCTNIPLRLKLSTSWCTVAAGSSNSHYSCIFGNYVTRCAQNGTTLSTVVKNNFRTLTTKTSQININFVHSKVTSGFPHHLQPVSPHHRITQSPHTHRRNYESLTPQICSFRVGIRWKKIVVFC